MYLQSFFNYTINIIFGQVNAPVALLPGMNPFNKSLWVGMMWLAVFFIFNRSVSFGMCSSASRSADCFAKSDRVSRYPFRRQTVESNSLRGGFHFNDESFLPAYKQRACCAARKYESKCRRGQVRFAPVKHSSGISLRLNCYLFLKKIDPTCTCICTGTWVAPSNIRVTTVNIRNVFYYNIYEYAHCPQQLLLTYSI